MEKTQVKKNKSNSTSYPPTNSIQQQIKKEQDYNANKKKQIKNQKE